MAPPLLLLTDIHLTFGGTPLLGGADMSVSTGERLCLVGRNGSGKSTLLKMAAAQLELGWRVVDVDLPHSQLATLYTTQKGGRGMNTDSICVSRYVLMQVASV